MANNQVLELQSFLISKGYLQSTYKTGYFGNKTLTAVKTYQDDRELPVTGFVGLLTRTSMANDSITEVATSTKIEVMAQESIPVATTIEPIVQVNTIAPIIVTEYNKAMEEITYTLGTPTWINKVSGDGQEYSYVELPISFDPTIVKVGNVATVEGTITNGTSTQAAGNEFAFSPTSPINQVMNLGDVHGTFDYTFTLKDNKGVTLYTQNGTVNIEK